MEIDDFKLGRPIQRLQIKQKWYRKKINELGHMIELLEDVRKGKAVLTDGDREELKKWTAMTPEVSGSEKGGKRKPSKLK